MGYALLVFLLTRPLPRSTLFPYTTLFRSVGVVSSGARQTERSLLNPLVAIADGHIVEDGEDFGRSVEGHTRSEEHTSELQSQFHLVCRLLLEKKKWLPRPWFPTLCPAPSR